MKKKNGAILQERKSCLTRVEKKMNRDWFGHNRKIQFMHAWHNAHAMRVRSNAYFECEQAFFERTIEKQQCA